MKSFHELIIHRESIRDYDPGRQVEKEKLERILDAGRLAPSAANRQPWRFYLVSDARYREKLCRCYPRPWFCNAPHVLVVAGRYEEAYVRRADGYNTLETDLAIAMDHMILAADAEGVASCWIVAFDPEMLKQTGIVQPDEKVFAITPLGYPPKGFVRKGVKERKKREEVVKYI
jgi:nitroreductase